jgi:hypothetical protein
MVYNFKVNNNNDSENVQRASQESRPRTVNSEKDFNKILQSKERRQKDDKNSKSAVDSDEIAATGSYDEISEMEETLSKQQPSLFDLSKKTKKEFVKFPSQKEELAKGEEVAQMASSDEMPTNNISKNLALKEKNNKDSLEKSLKEADITKKAVVKEDDGKEPALFSHEPMDLSYINPLGMANVSVNEINSFAAQKTEVSSNKLTMQQLIDSVVKAISTVQTQDKMDTVVTLKQPPLFEGANVVLTSYETARGEFNIRFENLTQQAKSFMDMQQNQDSLKFALQEKGYAVHIVVNTTRVETPNFIEKTDPSRQGQQEDQQNKQDQPRRNKKDQDAQ